MQLKRIELHTQCKEQCSRTKNKICYRDFSKTLNEIEQFTATNHFKSSNIPNQILHFKSSSLFLTKSYTSNPQIFHTMARVKSTVVAAKRSNGKADKSRKRRPSDVADADKTVEQWGEVGLASLRLKCNQYDLAENGRKHILQQRLYDHFNGQSSGSPTPSPTPSPETTPKHHTDAGDDAMTLSYEDRNLSTWLNKSYIEVPGLHKKVGSTAPNFARRRIEKSTKRTALKRAIIPIQRKSAIISRAGLLQDYIHRP